MTLDLEMLANCCFHVTASSLLWIETIMCIPTTLAPTSSVCLQLLLLQFTCTYKLASFPGLPRFCSSVCVQYNTQKQKSGQVWGRPGNTYHTMWNQCGHMKGSSRVQICTINLKASFFTSQAEFSRWCEHLGFCLVTERSMMKSSMLFKHGPLPPKSNLHPPDIIHVISVPSPSPFFTVLPLPCIILNANQRTKVGEAWEWGYMQTTNWAHQMW